MTLQANEFPKVSAGGHKRMLAMPRTILALMVREMATTYGRSPGGYLWAVLDPIGGVAMLTIVFTLFLRRPPLGTNFPIFYASGYLPFFLFMTISSQMAAAIKFSKSLLAYPSVTFVDALVARFLLNLLTQITVFVIVVGGIIIVFDVYVIIDFWAIVLAFSMAAALGAGVGTLNCYVMMTYEAWGRIWSILTRPLFLISGAFFLLENMPVTAQSIMAWNPLIHITAEMRKGFYSTYDPTFISPTYVFLFSLVTLALGLLLLRRHYRKLASDG